MIKNQFTDLVAKIGDRQDYFQGAGGNISLKINEREMLIKASGIRVKDMSSSEGLVKVSYANIREYFNENNGDESEYEDVIRSSFFSQDGKRPSIETGFHAILGNVVIHSHSVYVNVATCSSDVSGQLEKIFKGADINYKIVDYAPPGYYLTQKIRNAIGGDTITPCVIFMKNHGLIISARTLDEATYLHEKVNNTLVNYFKIKESYPVSKVQHLEIGRSISFTPFLKDFMRKSGEYFLHLQDFMLFPDLIVFCKDLKVSDDMNCKAKIIVNPNYGTIFYNTSNKEADFIEENLIAWAYILQVIKENKLEPISISSNDAKIIENMESEKYRKQLIL